MKSSPSICQSSANRPFQRALPGVRDSARVNPSLFFPGRLCADLSHSSLCAFTFSLCPSYQGKHTELLWERLLRLCPACKAGTAPPAELVVTGTMHRLCVPCQRIQPGPEGSPMGWGGGLGRAIWQLPTWSPTQHPMAFPHLNTRAGCYPPPATPFAEFTAPEAHPAVLLLGKQARLQRTPLCPTAWECCCPCTHHPAPSLPPPHFCQLSPQEHWWTAPSFQQLPMLETYICAAGTNTIHSSATGLNENGRGLGEPNDGLIYRQHHLSSRVCCRSSPTPSALWAQSPGGARGAGHWFCAVLLPAGALCQCQAPQGTAAPQLSAAITANWAALTLSGQTKCCFLHQQSG